MALSVTCPTCGQTYRVKDELAGKKFRCKHCQAIVVISNDMILAEEAEPDPILPTALPNLASSPAWSSPAAALETYSPAAPAAPAVIRSASDFADLEFKTKPRKKPPTAQQVSTRFLMWLFGISGLFTTLYVAAAMISFQWGLLVLFALLLPGIIGLGITSQIGLLTAAFREDISCGVRCLVIPIYSLYYLVSRWRYVARYGWMMMIQTLVIVIMGIVLLIQAPRETEQERAQRHRNESLAAIEGSLERSGVVIHSPPSTASGPVPPTSSPHMKSLEEWKQEALKQHELLMEEARKKNLHADSEFDRNSQSNPNRPPASPFPELFPVTRETPKPSLSDEQVNAVSRPVTDSTELKPKQTVYVKWGGSWYECLIVDVADADMPRIHYIGWGNGFDEQVTLGRVRIPNP